MEDKVIEICSGCDRACAVEAKIKGAEIIEINGNLCLKGESIIIRRINKMSKGE